MEGDIGYGGLVFKERKGVFGPYVYKDIESHSVSQFFYDRFRALVTYDVSLNLCLCVLACQCI